MLHAMLKISCQHVTRHANSLFLLSSAYTLRAAQTGTDDGFAGTSLLRASSQATDRQGIFRWSVDEPLSKHTSQNSAT